MNPLQQALQTYLDHLSVERGLAANTLASYRRDLRRYLGHLAGRDVTTPDGVTEPDVSAFLVALREGDDEHPALAANSAARAVVAVRGFHRFLLREGLTAAVPARGVRPPSPP
jgi:integrase/recombinase XerD